MAKDLEGKVFLVTGATEGIGKAAAMAFAKRGATLVLVGRSREKSERVVKEIKEASGNENVELLLGDLSKIADTRAVASAFRAKYDRLDVLVNNAGAVFTDHKLSDDGIEMTFALNHMAYFVLTTSLLDLIKKTPKARVISTSSGAHHMGKMDLATVAKRSGKSAGFGAYGDSKLANVLFTRELARRLEGSSATANCMHPGYVRTGFALNNGPIAAAFAKAAAALFARTPEKGADTIIWLATSDEAASYNGEYFQDRGVARTSKRARNDELAKGLWELSEKLAS
ncbi:SDR family oxidoreductase [Polyangium spumosum]|uniref:SDR family NAD(P)-dependent oxidoreductase n=1 Tax=Polyangium spumosum TaxID=889282 RepID=A0A6N7PP60_9BACT|nr:SDR family oxidoreductase [Polyangium spumosum]MRG93813.1 SDR family NAD(P)-dependent oxidoreductase [Polyangium spumosum]